MNLAVFGKLLLGLGGAIALLGILFWLLGQVGIPRMPGDITLRSGRVTFFFPIVTSIVLSLLLTLILNFVAHFRK